MNQLEPGEMAGMLNRNDVKVLRWDDAAQPQSNP